MRAIIRARGLLSPSSPLQGNWATYQTSSQCEKGFTLIELLVTFIFFGILTALVAPSFAKFRDRYEVQSSFQQVQQVLREAQREAIREGQTCTVTINLSKTPVSITAQNESSQACAISRTLPENVAVKTNLTDSNPHVAFSYRGSVALKEATHLNAVVFRTDQPDLEKPCLVLAPGIGIIRTGQYKKKVDEDLKADFCETRPLDEPTPEASPLLAVNPQPTTPYRIVNRLTGKALEGLGGTVAQYSLDGSAGQIWLLQPTDTGFVRIVSQQGQTAISIAGGETNRSNGASLQLEAIQSTVADQLWEIQPIGKYVVLRNHSTGKVIDIPGNDSNYADGTLIQQWEYRNELDQQWALEPVE